METGKYSWKSKQKEAAGRLSQKKNPFRKNENVLRSALAGPVTEALESKSGADLDLEVPTKTLFLPIQSHPTQLSAGDWVSMSFTESVRSRLKEFRDAHVLSVEAFGFQHPYNTPLPIGMRLKGVETPHSMQALLEKDAQSLHMVLLPMESLHSPVPFAVQNDSDHLAKTQAFNEVYSQMKNHIKNPKALDKENPLRSVFRGAADPKTLKSEVRSEISFHLDGLVHLRDLSLEITSLNGNTKEPVSLSGLLKVQLLDAATGAD